MNHVPTLLITDDEEDLLEILTYDLAPLGYKIVTAKNGKVALETILKGGITAVLSDINMPLMSGLALLAEINARELDIPFIFITGYGDKEKAIAALRLGAVDFIDKPYEREALRESVRKAMELGQSLQSVTAEIEAFCRDHQIPADQADRLRKAQRAVLISKKENAVYMNKKKAS